jgi:hypothetical protein
MTEFSDLKGKTIESIDGLNKGSECVTFDMTDGSQYTMSHAQD